ncbi:MAG: prepilin-type N-terminal cleavage/methylation domain-containing protein [Planctomycetes bacterium]|nr:prepilin-type N-terminal cleavage/methylation domain-containing protein [Planctomycetota bacterium]
MKPVRRRALTLIELLVVLARSWIVLTLSDFF